jgi:drug/metabolite transporter (DMT)-like permease
LFFGYFVFGETYSSEVFLGILIVVISVIVSVLLKKKSEKPAMLDETTTG